MEADQPHINNIPIVDFSDYSLDIAEECVQDETLQRLACEIHEAFSTVGFVYLKNYGIGRDKVNSKMKKYFQ